ncbi:universal stress protein [Sphingobacterium yanglingense]|uniref:Nucleotide-binding universal stress UspA family protein n=1 Tax=Sphingobacterium yanglingense TaxID=1437280 RepID=A0A4V3DDM3_9SPHI|nr:universal stress protein [Sphingobacterium yanglingense]TDQ76384.1 nucleotide-binding universal stress UspA family protein [Sphingobacterium yanglingense]
MEKILVATDLSASSISAIQFAYKLSQLKGATLIIVHVYHLLKPKSWRPHRFENYRQVRREFILAKLNKFLDRIFTNIETPIVNFEIDLQMNPNIVTTILRCVAKHKCSCICLGIQGIGRGGEAISTSANKLVAKSPVPVISVPSFYKTKTIDSICYASDMVNYQKEIKKILGFVRNLNIEISLLHVIASKETLLKAKLLEARLFKRIGVAVKVKYVLRSSTSALIEDVDLAIRKMRPSLVVFFLNKSKHFLNSILYVSTVQGLSFLRKVPILTYKK